MNFTMNMFSQKLKYGHVKSQEGAQSPGLCAEIEALITVVQTYGCMTPGFMTGQILKLRILRKAEESREKGINLKNKGEFPTMSMAF